MLHICIGACTGAYNIYLTYVSARVHAPKYLYHIGTVQGKVIQPYTC